MAVQDRGAQEAQGRREGRLAMAGVDAAVTAKVPAQSGCQTRRQTSGTPAVAAPRHTNSAHLCSLAGGAADLVVAPDVDV